jgi:hypothetical protein
MMQNYLSEAVLVFCKRFKKSPQAIIVRYSLEKASQVVDEPRYREKFGLELLRLLVLDIPFGV